MRNHLPGDQAAPGIGIVRSAVRIALFLSAFAALTGQAPPDQVLLNNVNGCQEGAVAVWGKDASMQTGPFAFKGTSPIVVGDLQEVAGGANQAVSFMVGRAPGINSNVQWNNSSPFSITYPAPFNLPIKVWVLNTDLATSTMPACDFSCKVADMTDFVTWANLLLERERTGIQLTKGANWIVDETANALPAVTRYRWVNESTDCDPQALIDLGAQLKQAGALNVYIVKRVESSSTRGVQCNDIADMAFVASKAEWGTFLHEIVHMFDLSHVDGDPEFDEENVMHSESSVRAFLTEGQAFHLNFAKASVLNQELKLRTVDERICFGSGTEVSRPCLPLSTSIWREK